MEVRVVNRVLRWIRETLPERGKPVPKEAFAAYVAACPQTVVELVIADSVSAPFCGKVLLQYRGSPWDAWHTIGGFVHAGETMVDACHRHAADAGVEIEVATEVGFSGLIGWREDTTHPYGWDRNGHIVHHYFLCRAANVRQDPTLRWFERGEIPTPLLRDHEAHVAAYYALR